MGQGITHGTQIQCNECQAFYLGWSDDTITIKGPIPHNDLCNKCNRIKNEKLSQTECSICHCHFFDTSPKQHLCSKCRLIYKFSYFVKV